MAEVQDAMSSASLADFQVPVSVVLITQTQDWQTRQQIAYAAQKGLMKDDFLAWLTGRNRSTSTPPPTRRT